MAEASPLETRVRQVALLLGQHTGHCAEPGCRRPVRLLECGLVPPHPAPAQYGHWCPGGEQPPAAGGAR